MVNHLDIEIILNTTSRMSKKSIISVVTKYLKETNVRPNTILSYFNPNENPILHSDVKAIIIGDVLDYGKTYLDFTAFEINWYVYTLDIYGPLTDYENGEDDEELSIATHLTLPSADLVNLWESLYYDNNIKDTLLKYAQTMIEFSNRGVDSNVVCCNRVILLHGPPGTGKTSLCRALAHKLTIRMQDVYDSGLLVEINSHSLFSKWFSESGKLVTKMFNKIKLMVDNKKLLVCVLIDEVESLTHARDMCLSGSEPSDSIRVVNAVLTQLDLIKRHSNVMIFATSNMTEAIDLAFIDRADIKQFLGLPSTLTIYKIYYSCLQELAKAQIINSNHLVDPVNELVYSNGIYDNFQESTKKLLSICAKSVGLSGRSLRKIPFIAHALFLNKHVDIDEFLYAMDKAVEREHKERQYFHTVKKE